MATKRRHYQTGYVDGSTVRELQALPEERERVRRKKKIQDEQKRKQKLVPKSKAPAINFGMMLVLTVAIITTLSVCVDYLKVQASITNMNREIKKIESDTKSLSIANDAKMEAIHESINLDHIYDVAVNEMGMVFPYNNQVITYENNECDYVRQYGSLTGNEEVPLLDIIMQKIMGKKK